MKESKNKIQLIWQSQNEVMRIRFVFGNKIAHEKENYEKWRKIEKNREKTEEDDEEEG